MGCHTGDAWVQGDDLEGNGVENAEETTTREKIKKREMSQMTERMSGKKYRDKGTVLTLMRGQWLPGQPS